MKKTLALFLVLCLAFVFAACGEKAEKNEEKEPEQEQTGSLVYVSVSTAGKIQLAAEAVYVNDTNEDGKLSVDEVLMQAHEQKCPDGASAYKSSDMGYGLSVETLWGETNGGSYGTYVNNLSVINLEDTVSEGDYVYSYSYEDLTTWTDQYAFFDDFQTSTDNGELSLHLSSIGFDENWNSVKNNVADATILIGGKVFGTTDADGNITISIPGSGNYTVTAVSENQVLVPPICNVTVK